MSRFFCSLLVLLFLSSFHTPRDMRRGRLSIGFTAPILRTIEKERYDCDSLKRHYGSGKSFVDRFELASLVALSYFPELNDVEINFIHYPLNTTMAARPVYSSLFKSRRKYNVFINSLMECEVRLDEISFNGQVGIIAHELAHIADYESKSFGRVVNTASLYIFSRHLSKKAYERSMDAMIIKKGLGWQLYDCYYYIQHQSRASVKYKKFKEEYYYTMQEIIKAISEEVVYRENMDMGK